MSEAGSTMSILGFGTIALSFIVGYSTSYIFSNSKQKKQKDEIENLQTTVEDLQNTITELKKELSKKEIEKPKMIIKEDPYIDKIKLEIKNF